MRSSLGGTRAPGMRSHAWVHFLQCHQGPQSHSQNIPSAGCSQHPLWTHDLKLGFPDTQTQSALGSPPTPCPPPLRREQQVGWVLLLDHHPSMPCWTEASLSLPKIPLGNECIPDSGQGVLVNIPQRPSSTREYSLAGKMALITIQLTRRVLEG